MDKPTCEFGIDCSECEGRGMCSSYAAFMYEKGKADAKAEMEAWERQVGERFDKKH